MVRQWGTGCKVEAQSRVMRTVSASLKKTLKLCSLSTTGSEMCAILRAGVSEKTAKAVSAERGFLPGSDTCLTEPCLMSMKMRNHH